MKIYFDCGQYKMIIDTDKLDDFELNMLRDLNACGTIESIKFIKDDELFDVDVDEDREFITTHNGS